MIEVLVFTPYLDRVEPGTLEALTRLEWEGPLSLLLQRDNPHGEDRVRNHLHQYRQGREGFLSGKAEAMLIIEADILPPPNALQLLYGLQAELAYGIAVTRATPHVVNVFERYADPQARNVGESLTLRPALWEQALRKGETEVSGGGIACVLVRRHVLEAIDFRSEDGVWCDTFFTRDCYAAGYSMKASARVLCGHVDRDGTVLWPERAAYPGGHV